MDSQAERERWRGERSEAMRRKDWPVCYNRTEDDALTFTGIGQTRLQQYHTILHAEDAEQSRGLSWPRADTRQTHPFALCFPMAGGVPSPNLSPAKRSREGFQQPQHENHRIEAKDRLMDAQLEKRSCPSIAVELTTQATGRHAGWLAVTSFAERSHAPSGSDQPKTSLCACNSPKANVLQTDELTPPVSHWT